MKRRSTVLALAAAACAWAGTRADAHAEPARVLVVPTGEEPTCATPEALAAALRRHAPWPTQLVKEAPPGAEDAAVVRVRRGAEEKGERIVIEITSGGTRSLEEVAAPPCDATPDVLAAQIASTLAPAPLADPTPPLPPLDRIADEVTEALALQGVALPGDLELTRAAGGWTLELRGQNCFARQFTGELPAGRDRRVAHTAAIATALLGRCPRAKLSPLDRTMAVAESIDDSTRSAGWWRASGLFVAGAGGGVAAWQTALLFDEDEDVPGARAFALAGSAIAVGGGLTGWALRDRDVGDTVSILSGAVGVSVGVMGLAYELPSLTSDGDDGFYEVWIIAGTVGLVSSALYAMDRILTPAIGTRRLAELRAMLDTPEKRSRLSSTELAAIEREYRRWRAPRPGWYYATPLYVGAGIALAMASSEGEGDEVNWNGVAVVTLLLEAVLVTLVPPGEHDERLRGLGLDVGVTPIRGGGAVLGVGGVF